MITVELDEKQESVEILLDIDGIDRMIQILARLRGKNTHEHLMTPAWGGHELDETSHGSNKLVHHLVLGSRAP